MSDTSDVPEAPTRQETFDHLQRLAHRGAQELEEQLDNDELRPQERLKVIRCIYLCYTSMKRSRYEPHEKATDQSTASDAELEAEARANLAELAAGTLPEAPGDA